MDIPKPEAERWAFYEKIINDCLASRADRRTAYARWRTYYLYGTDMGDTNEVFNKIYPHIDQILAFMYSNETTRFSLELAAEAPRIELKRVPKLNKAINDEWHGSNGDIVFSNALEWAHVYGTTLVKTRWNGKQVEPFVVDPHDFGVLREDVSQLSRQEAFVQSYYITEGQFIYEMEQCEHPRLKQLMKVIQPANVEMGRHSDLMSAVVATSQIPTSGGIQNAGSYQGAPLIANPYTAKVTERLIEMHELYLFDNSIEDFRTVTLASPAVVVFDRPIDRLFVEQEIPFVQVCPVPSHDYFFGRSEVERLVPLQLLRNERFRQVRKMMAKQARPPVAMSGFNGDMTEIKNAMDTPGGVAYSDIPSAKADVLSPTIPDDLFADIEKIDKQFEEMSGINNVMAGRGEAGVRSTGHASQLAQLGSTRTKKRALIVEDSLEKLATLYLQIMQKYDDSRKYVDDDGQTFAASQFTENYVVKVDAHSNSPIFTTDLAEKAMELFKVGAITKERLIEMMGVPMEQLLKEDLKTKIEPADKARAAADAAGKTGLHSVK
jgi:hypothetical protein